MRVLIWGAPPWANTGYAVGARNLARVLGEKHSVAISPLTRVPVDMEWQGIAVMANRDPDIGKAGVAENFRRFEAELLILWFESWLLGDFLVQAGLSHATIVYSAVDHSPLSPKTKRAVQGVLKVVPYCNFARRVYEAAGIKSAEPVYHGVDTALFHPMENKKELKGLLELPEESFIFGINAANIGPRKNIPGMMRAFKEFLERLPGAKKDSYLLVHSYPVADDNFPEGYNLYEVWDALGGAVENFRCTTAERYLQGLSDQGMARWYNAVDVLLNCSMGEGFGFPILEAAACGVPSIATRFSSMEELVGEDRGWLVEPAGWVPMQHISSFMALPSLEGMVRSMEEAYRSREKVARRGKKARKFAEGLDWKLVKEDWLSLLEEAGKEREDRPLNMEFLSPWRLGLIPDALPEESPRRVLDIGCGLTEPYKPYLERLGEYVALDLRGGDGAIQGDIGDLPFRDKEFGFAWVSEVLEHLEEGHDKAVAEAKRVACHGVIIFPTTQARAFSYDPSHHEVKGVEYVNIASGYGLISW